MYLLCPRELTLKRQNLTKALPTAKSKLEAGRIAQFQGSPSSIVTSVNRALKNAEVQQALAAQVQTLAERTGVTPDWALTNLKANVDEARADGKDSRAAVNKGVELALKFHKLLGNEEQPVKEGDTYNQVVLQGYTEEQLEQLLEAMRSKGVR